MIAIRTKLQVPTDRLGSRVSASAGANRISLGWRHDLSSEANHDAAARALCQRLGWAGPMYRGHVEGRTGMGNGYVYVFAAESERVEPSPGAQ